MTKRKVDRGTLLGVLIAVSGVVIGLLLDGGSLKQILQPTAAFIVLGGTLGAILIQFPMNIVLEAFRQMRHVLLEPSFVAEDAIEDLVGYCMQVRRHGMLILDSQLENITDLFLRKGLTFAVDGVPVRELRNMLEVDLSLREDHEESIASVLEAAGGFAPTLGIVGAVLGLIQVMQRWITSGRSARGSRWPLSLRCMASAWRTCVSCACGQASHPHA